MALRLRCAVLLGRPASGIELQYLLTGMARCGVCGGSLVVRSHQHGRRRVFAYVRSSYHLRGHTVCVNKHELPERAANAALLATIEQDLLRPEVIEHALASAVDYLTASGPNLETKRAHLRQDLATVEAELQRLASAVAAWGDLPVLLQELKIRKQRRTTLRAELAAVEESTRVAAVHPEATMQDLKKRLEERRALLLRQVAQARQVLRKHLVGQIVFTPDEDATGRVFRSSGSPFR